MCGTILIAFEILVARRAGIWDLEPRSDAGVITVLEERVLRSAPPPCVLVAGSSRLRDAIAPIPLERALGVERGAVLNVALTAGTPFDAQLLLDRHPELFARTEVVVLGVEDWYANGAIAPSERDQRYAPLRARRSYGEHTLGMWLGWAWQTYGAHKAIRRYARRLGRRGPALDVLPDGRLDWHDSTARERRERESVRREADAFFTNYDDGDYRIGQLDRLVHRLRARGLRVIMLQVPLHPEYQARMREAYPEALNAFRQAMRRVARQRGAELLMWGDDLEECGLRLADLRDYGHFANSGAERFVSPLARAIGPIRCRDPEGHASR